MNKLTFSVLLGISTAAMLMFFVLPQFQGIPVESEKKARLDDVLARFEEIRKKKDDIVANYSAVSESDVARLDRMLPTDPDIGHLLVNLDLLIRKDGLQMTGIQFQPPGKGTTMNQPPVDAAAEAQFQKIVRYEKLPLNLSLIGTYENFRQFLIDIENVIRLTDVRSITFSAGTVQGTNYTFSVQADTYYLSGQ